MPRVRCLEWNRSISRNARALPSAQFDEWNPSQAKSARALKPCQRFRPRWRGPGSNSSARDGRECVCADSRHPATAARTPDTYLALLLLITDFIESRGRDNQSNPWAFMRFRRLSWTRWSSQELATSKIS